jgi:hypothetical protein
MTQHRIAFSFDNDEYLPRIIGFGHNLKEENVCMCTSSIVEQTNERLIVRKNMNIHNNDIEIIVNYDLLVTGAQFVAASLTMKTGDKEKKYIIPYYNSYKSLQIGKYGYDNIDVVKLPCNIFL